MVGVSADDIKRLDEQQLQRFHWKIVLIAGIVFFTDAYDLFVIGVVTALLKPLWHLSTPQIATLNAIALGSAAFGSILFGMLADKFGRKKLYGIEVLILFIGSLLSMLSPSFMWLLLTRAIVGLGIGGDYSCSALIVSESANVKNRGTLVLLVFAMQALGLIVGPLIAALFLYLHISPDIIWRTLLGLGAIPAASVFWLRRKINESPHYLMAKQKEIQTTLKPSHLNVHLPFKKLIPQGPSLWRQPWLSCLIGTAGAWFLLDVAFYGNSVSSVLILKNLSPTADILTNTLLSAAIFACFAAPGYAAAAFFVDKIGHKFLQFLGFGVMALLFAIIAFLPNVYTQINLFLLLFGMSYFFTNFGPNSTTFLIPSEIYPTIIRGQAHGISAAIGKAGAFVGAFLVPIIIHKTNLSMTMAIMSMVCIGGVLVTCLVSEMQNKSLTTLEN